MEVSAAAQRLVNQKNKKTIRPRKLSWRKNPFNIFLCKIFLQLLTICAVAWTYGNFTDGLPEYFDYEHILATSNVFALQLCYVFSSIEISMLALRTDWNKLAVSLHQKPFLCWAAFLLIIAFITHVGNYNQTH